MPARAAAELMETRYGTVPATRAPGRSDTPVVVVDDDGRPRWVVGPAGPGPAVVIPPEELVSALSAMPGVLRLLNEGLPAVLVAEGDRVIGVLSSEVIRVELRNAIEDGDAIGTVLDGSDYALYGDPSPAADLIRIRCAACGVVSAIEEFPPADGLCPNGRGHLLVPDWEV
ncbi:hypothetical protein OG339_35715 [Streptosporangium sp. NBC_01495]|uniref:hypothetical protein n=1 Tax=Streptosporangium sp. NBC_01495 TaxID=2903899 RepID=UPI002E30F64D|nr:hypothetical protein [Streptosporangium sp. NBC_01495]